MQVCPDVANKSNINFHSIDFSFMTVVKKNLKIGMKFYSVGTRPIVVRSGFFDQGAAMLVLSQI